MNYRLIIAPAIAAALALTACGGDDGSTAAPTTVAQAPVTAAPAAPAAGSSVAAKASTIDGIGNVLVGPEGLTLYGFTNDVDARSACDGTCADAWPPVIVDSDWTVGPGLDSGIFNTTPRSDGSLQLVAGKWPLYYYSGDAAPGDANGQSSGDVWFVAGTDGALIQEGAATAAPAAPADAGAGAALVSTGDTALGAALVDAEGLTLYGFTDDADGVPTCVDACADAWPPLTVDSAELPAGLDANVFSVVERPDGTFQLKAGKWPLYHFAGDAAPGDTNGQNSGGIWFVAAPDGSLIKDGAAAADAGASSDTGSDY